MKKAITYYRVSTKRQGRSGLGLKAQKNSVRLYAKANKLKIIREFKEIESTRKNNRPKLQEALNTCKQSSSILLIAKLDRLDRNVAFISKLMESGVDFVAVDNPNANKFILHILAAFAEYERDQISKRTKEALIVAKSKGVELGKYGRKVLSKENKLKAKRFALKMKPIIEQIRNEGHKSIRKITIQLNERKVSPYYGKKFKWHPTSVYNVQKRISDLANKSIFK
jgi:DNA invertase Pin-like site-specific DNA recombinase